ncbi:hypothetical protein [Phenylobacterium sp.]|uniref:hypothetical protein n=1 Tax=Phenylobacterium sp. TaxID=1871053 RepID=UPI00286B7C60|nr:hypothetical protein [Phenylobacterium sp.]
MKPMRWRALTQGERRLSAEVFGATLDLDRIRVFSLPFWTRPFVPNGWLVVWPAAGAYADFSLAPLWIRSVLVHELVHAWQAQCGVNLPLAKLRCGDGPSAYAYDPTDGREFSALNIEQQAMVVQHAYLVDRGAAAPYPAPAYARILEAWPNRDRSRPRNF